MSTTFKKLPAYVTPGTTPADMLTAQKEYERLMTVPGYSLVQGPRRAALQAVLNSGGYVTPLQAIEFAAVLEEKNYMPGVSGNATAAHRDAERKKQHQWQAEENARKVEAAKRPVQITSLRDAQNLLSPLDYAAWCKANPGIVAKELR